MNKLFAWAGTLVSLTLAIVAPASHAAGYPDHPIRIIVPYPPGDLADVITRLLGNGMAQELGQSIVVENHPGASGLIGLQAASRAEPDGYTLVMGQMGAVVVAPLTNDWPIDVRKSLTPVALAYTNYMMLVAKPDFPARTLPELIAYSKEHPGRVRVGTNGEGGFPHLSMELLKEKTGFDFTNIPYKGSTQIMSDLMSGRVELTVFGYSGLYPYVQDGRLIALGVTGRDRAPNAPNIPTFGESVPGYEALGWFGLFAPAGTPADVVGRINKALNKAVSDPQVQVQAQRLGLDPATGTPAQFARIWQDDYAKWGGTISHLGLDKKK
ncbi:ABC transporter substrate-binding protein [Bordetella sputigena]|uniref:Bug family tripartite tricarboxylate transporter substrate binding protein n=1 Tax=Bordetella sputigena TaxID=1416810 RepID=UPI0039F13274